MIVDMHSAMKDSFRKLLGRNVRSSFLGAGRLSRLSLSVLLCGFPVLAQSPLLPVLHGVESGPVEAPGAETSAGAQLPDEQLPGSVSGTIIDQTGTAVVGARVRLTREDQSPNQEMTTGDDGQFSFANIAPGPFHLTIASEGFSTQSSSGILHSGEAYIVPQIALVIAPSITEVKVELSPIEMAQEQIKEQEKQRVLGIFPNFYVSYVPNAAPLTSKQKFELAWKTTVDPVRFLTVGAIAGGEQATNRFSGYGQGAQGYAKRYGASYADFVTNAFIGGAILPSLLKQDPRYFYKGTGSRRSRALYAIANAVICKGDNGHWQPNYSEILGSLAAGGISNLYYPASDRNGAALTFENALIGIGASAAINVLQEFVLRKVTPNVPHYASTTP
jgi:Carboxypeptidase regulatory-like domain